MRFYFAMLFTASVFLMSNDSSLKLSGVHLSSLAGLLMFAFFLMEGLARGEFVLRRHPLQAPLFMLLAWSALSLLFSWMAPSKMVPEAAYGYAWARGANGPSVRGAAFLIRLFLSVFAIEFLISSIDTPRRYFTVFNALIFFYALACLFGAVQLFAHFILGVDVGNVVIYPNFRIGGYVGEPQTYGILLVSGLFPVMAALKGECGDVWFKRRTLKAILLIAFIDLVFTFSVSMLLAVVAALLVFGRDICRRTLLIGAASAAVLVVAFYPVVHAILVNKLMSEALSVNSRTLTWAIGYSAMTEHYIAGVGIGQLPLFSEAISNSLNLSFASLDFYTVRVNTLNTYLEWGAETGAVGLLITAYIAFKAWRMGRAQGGGREFRLVKFAFGGTLVALCISANSYGGAFYLGCVALALAMYVSGMGLFARS